MEILDGIPEGMLPYYQRATDLLQKKRESEKVIAKAILRWVLAAVRPLLVSELAEALQLESRETKLQQSVKSAVEGLCLHLVQVNANNVVQPVHLTARDFLLSSDAKDFQVVKAVAHERIASICLGLLSAPGFHPPKHRLQLRQDRKWSPALLDYAATNFGEHVYSAVANSVRLLLGLQGFLKTNVLSWIEHVARQGDLHCIIKTARNLRTYIDRYVERESVISTAVKLVGDWSIDLTRLVASFGDALISPPASIYFVIPPLTPSTSAVHRQFGHSPDALSVVGENKVAWDDCLASIRFDGQLSASALACGHESIVVGCKSGKVVVYHHQTFQKQLVLHRKSFWVDRVHVDRAKGLVIAARKHVSAWDLDGRLQWEYFFPSRRTDSVILLTSSSDSVVGFTCGGYFLRWDSSDGTVLEDQLYQCRTPEGSSGGSEALISEAYAYHADISPNTEVLAISYPGRIVCLWFCQTKDFIGWATDHQSGYLVAVAFNPNPEIDRLLVAYSDHHLAVHHSFTGVRVASTVADKFSSRNILESLECATVSPDGRTIACVDGSGLLSFHDFETLSLLYHMEPPGRRLQIMQFSQDSSSLVVLVDTHSMRVWSPSILRVVLDPASFRVLETVLLYGSSSSMSPLTLRGRNRKTSSKSVVEDATEPLPPGLRQPRSMFTTLCAHPTLQLVVACQEGGVVAYSSVTGKNTRLLIASTVASMAGSRP